MEISYGDKMKFDMKVALIWIKRRMKKIHKVTIDDMREDLENCGNPFIARLWNETKELSDGIKENYQRNVLIEFPIVILWTIYKDTAYIGPFAWVMTHILRDSEELLPLIEKYYVDIPDMYLNRWHDTKKHTQEQKDDGVIPNIDGILSSDEKIFVPPEQHKVTKKIIEALDKKVIEKDRKRG